MAKGLDTDGVSLAYEFTLFSNMLYMYADKLTVLLPYGFTLFSNAGVPYRLSVQVLLPYGFTLFSNDILEVIARNMFYYLMDLHYSQTK